MNQTEIDFLTFATLQYSAGDGEERWSEARDILRGHPELRSSLFVAAALGDASAVESALARDPQLASARDKRGHTPLLCLCYSRVACKEANYEQAAWLLLRAGADPSAHFVWGGEYRFCALTGAIGGGEQGTERCPPHPCWEVLVPMLLDAGADPNAAQALYNTMGSDRGTQILRLLIEAGLGPDAPTTWSSGGETTLGYLLFHAAGAGRLDQVKLILDQGVPADTPNSTGQTPWENASLCAQDEVVSYLVGRGATLVPLEPVLEALACAKTGRADRLRELHETPGLLRETAMAHPGLLAEAAGRGHEECVRIILSAGIDPDAHGGTPALHASLFPGHLAVAQLLLDAGADADQKDAYHGGDAMGFATHGHCEEAPAWLAARLEAR